MDELRGIVGYSRGMSTDDVLNALYTLEECELLTEGGWCSVYIKSLSLSAAKGQTDRAEVEVVSADGRGTETIVGVEVIRKRLRRVVEATITVPPMLLERGVSEWTNE